MLPLVSVVLLPYVSVTLLGLAALGGAFVAYLRIMEFKIPTAVPLGHGAVAASGVFVLYMGIFGGSIVGLGVVAFGLFLLAALGGAYLFSFQIKGEPIPIKFMIAHGLVAVTAYVLLLVSVFGGGGPGRLVP